MNFKVLNILHDWADNRGGFVNLSKGLTVEFNSDVSIDARHVANFIGVIMGCTMCVRVLCRFQYEKCTFVQLTPWFSERTWIQFNKQTENQLNKIPLIQYFI